MKLLIIMSVILYSSAAGFTPPITELDEGLYLIEGGAADTLIADPGGDGFYFTVRTNDGNAIFRYDTQTNEIVKTGIQGIHLGYAFEGRSLVIKDEGRLIVINEKTYETEGIAGGIPVAFFGGNSQIFLRNGAIYIGNLYEGKSSRVDFDLGDFIEIYFYPISLKKIYFRVIRGDGTGEIYEIEAEKGGFEVTPVEGAGLIIDTENRYAYFGG